MSRAFYDEHFLPKSVPITSLCDAADLDLSTELETSFATTAVGERQFTYIDVDTVLKSSNAKYDWLGYIWAYDAFLHSTPLRFSLGRRSRYIERFPSPKMTLFTLLSYVHSASSASAGVSYLEGQDKSVYFQTRAQSHVHWKEILHRFPRDLLSVSPFSLPLPTSTWSGHNLTTPQIRCGPTPTPLTSPIAKVAPSITSYITNIATRTQVPTHALSSLPVSYVPAPSFSSLKLTGKTVVSPI